VVVIIHKQISPNLALKNMKGNTIIHLYIFLGTYLDLAIFDSFFFFYFGDYVF